MTASPKTPLQDQLDAITANTRKLVQPERLAISEQMVSDLFSTGIEDRILPVGTQAPSFALEDARTGKSVSSADLLALGPLVVNFFRGRWCPYCVTELETWRELIPHLRERGALFVAISPQTPVNSRKSVRQNKLSFPILSDTNNDVASAFGLKFALPDYLVELYRSLKNDLPAFNGDPSWTLPMPSRFVIAPDRAIVYAEINPDYTRRPEPEAMLPALQKVTRVAA